MILTWHNFHSQPRGGIMSRQIRCDEHPTFTTQLIGSAYNCNYCIVHVLLVQCTSTWCTYCKIPLVARQWFDWFEFVYFYNMFARKATICIIWDCCILLYCIQQLSIYFIHVYNFTMYLSTIIDKQIIKYIFSCKVVNLQCCRRLTFRP